MKFSVVIPTYRRPDLLIRCLNALVCQNFDKSDYQIIVVSDGPDEATSEAMKLWTDAVVPMVRYMATPEKKGPAASRNAGWRAAKGQLIAFTDDDCVPGPNWLQTIWKNYCNEELVVFTGRVIVPRSKRPTDYELNISRLETAEFITANCICSRGALELTGGFDERFGMAWREDSDLHFKLIERGIPIRQVPALVTHPVRTAPWGVSIKEQKKSLYNALLYKKYPGLYRQRIKPRPSWNYYGMVFLFAGMLFCFFNGYWLSGALMLGGWLVLLILFIGKRLEGTSRDVSHVSEMIVTSMVIPFASIFWQWYGAFKFRVFFL